jgi:hypothetical protein
MDVFQYINEPGISLDERSRRKTASHALIYGASPQRLAQLLTPRRFGFKKFGLGFMISKELLTDDRYFTEALRRIRMQNLPLHLQPLDAGDLKFMKQMGWDEMEYRVWLFEEVEDKTPLKLGSMPVAASQEELQQAEGHGLEGPIRGRHYDRIITDDIGEVPSTTGGFLGRAPFSPEGTMSWQSSAHTGAILSRQDSDASSSVGVQRHPASQEHRSWLSRMSFSIGTRMMAKARDSCQIRLRRRTPAITGALSEVYQTTLAYLEVAQNFLNQTSINIESCRTSAMGAVMAQGVGRG